MRTRFLLVWLGLLALAGCGPLGPLGQGGPASPGRPNACPWLGKYPLGLLGKGRSARIAEQGHVCMNLKTQFIDYDEKETSNNGRYSSFNGTYEKVRATTCVKYGWVERHQIGFGLPYSWVDFDVGPQDIDESGVENVFIFDKWLAVTETRTRPAIALDLWYYFDTGEPADKLGSDEDAVKVSAEISKAWRGLTVHVNPGYVFRDDADSAEVNLAVLFKTGPQLQLGLELDHASTDNKGRYTDLITGAIMKLGGSGIFTVGVVANVENTTAFRDKVGLVIKVGRRF